MKPFRRHSCLVVLVIALMFSTRASAGPPARLTIQSTPAGATVYLNGKATSVKTPVRLNVSPGKQSVLLKKDGYKDVSRDIEVYSGIAFASFKLEESTLKAPSRNTQNKPIKTAEKRTQKKMTVPEKNEAAVPSFSEDTKEAEDSDVQVTVSGPAKIVKRGQDTESKDFLAMNVLPEENPFRKWMSDNKPQEIPDAQIPELKPEKKEQKPKNTFALVQSRKKEKSPQKDEWENLIPLNQVKSKKNNTSTKKTVTKKVVKEITPATDAMIEIKNPLMEDTVPKRCVAGDSVSPETQSNTPCINESETDWPSSVEELMIADAKDLPIFPEKFNILLLGLDRRDRKGKLATGAAIPLDKLRRKPANSDVIMVIQLDFMDNKIRMVSIPRDTKVRIPGRRGNRKANAAYAYGREKLAKKMVEQFLDIKIHRYVVADWYSAKKSISMFKSLGLDYNGYSEKELFWHLRKRSFRRGDFRRIERSQQFLRYSGGEYLRLYNELKASKGTMNMVKKAGLDLAISQGMEFTETDLSKQEIDLLTFAFRDYDMRETTMAQVRGRGKLEGAEDGDGGCYFYTPYKNHSFDDIVAWTEDHAKNK